MKKTPPLLIPSIHPSRRFVSINQIFQTNHKYFLVLIFYTDISLHRLEHDQLFRRQRLICPRPENYLDYPNRADFEACEVNSACLPAALIFPRAANVSLNRAFGAHPKTHTAGKGEKGVFRALNLPVTF